MKKTMRITNLSFVFLSLAIVFASCVKKDDLYKENTTESNRKQLVQLYGAENDINLIALDVLPTIEDFILIEVVRYPNSQSDANQPLTVKLVKNSTLITDYNNANSTSFVELPLAAYSFTDDLNSLTFAAGESIKQIVLHLKKDQMDLSKQYALGFSIADVGSDAKINTSLSNVLYSIGLKNAYDGKYRLDGAFYHPTQSPGYDPFTVNVEMHTTGSNKVKLFVPDFGGYYSPGLFAGVLNAFGAQEPEFTIDAATNAVTVQNAYAGAVTFYMMAPGYNSHYDPATKKIYAKWGYNYDPGPVFNPANNREWTDVFTYLGPR